MNSSAQATIIPTTVVSNCCSSTPAVTAVVEEQIGGQLQAPAAEGCESSAQTDHPAETCFLYTDSVFGVEQRPSM